MALRFPCKPVQHSPGHLMFPYWGALGFYRPSFDVYLVGPNGLIDRVHTQVDTGADQTIFGATVALNLRLPLPFPRQLAISGAGGTYAGVVSFPPDGLVSLFVTDYREYCFLPAPLIGFHALTPSASSQRSVLGIAGFLQYFRYTQEPSPPFVELDPASTFVGLHGPLPLKQPLLTFAASLRSAGPKP